MSPGQAATDMQSRQRPSLNAFRCRCFHGSGIRSRKVKSACGIVRDGVDYADPPISRRFLMVNESKREFQDLPPKPLGNDTEAEINASGLQGAAEDSVGKDASRARESHPATDSVSARELICGWPASRRSAWKDRSRILGLAANAMRHILVDHARRISSWKKRGREQCKSHWMTDWPHRTTRSWTFWR